MQNVIDIFELIKLFHVYDKTSKQSYATDKPTSEITSIIRWRVLTDRFFKREFKRVFEGTELTRSCGEHQNTWFNITEQQDDAIIKLEITFAKSMNSKDFLLMILITTNPDTIEQWLRFVFMLFL
jgi:hypothetical protein